MRIASSVSRSTALLILAVMAVSGCGKHIATCKQNNKDYIGAKEMPPLKAPDGLEPPDTRNALKVPVLQSPERVRGRDEPCLDAPPPFSTTKTTAPAAPATPPKQPREVPTQ